MARTLWTGFVSFGLVTVPVGMYGAVSEQAPRFNQINQATSNRVRYKKVDEVTGDEVPAEDIIRGFDTGADEYVLVTDEELKDVAPGKSDTIEISDFVDLSSVDPVFFRQGYYLAPRGKGADRAYTLLRQAMEESGKAAIATLVLRDKQHLVAIRAGADVLILQTMFFPEEIRSPREELATLPDAAGFDGPELEPAKALIESLTVEWQPERYENGYLKRIDALLASKHGAKVKVASVGQAAPKASVVDLMSALQQSVERTSATRAASAKKAATADAAKPAGSAVKPAGSAVTAIAAKRGRIDLAAQSKAELSRLASTYDIAGRARMSKAELVAALTIAGADTPARARAATA